MRNKVGDIEESRKGIANTSVALFTEDFFSSRNDERKDEKDNDGRLDDNCDHVDENIEDDEQKTIISQILP